MDLPRNEPRDTAVSQAERRHFQRYSVNVPIEVHKEGSDVPIRMQTSDLSRGGCYVQLMTTLPIGTYVNATLWLAELAVHVHGRIVTRHPQFGNGIMFLEFKDNGVQLLARYLDTIVDEQS